MKGKAVIPLVLGLCIGLLAVKFGIDTIKKAQASSADRGTVSIVVAREDINAQEEITQEMVDLIEGPETDLIPHAERFTSLEDVIGRVAAKSIPMSAPVLSTMLAPPGTPVGMVGLIPPGFRAVSVRIDEVTGVAYQIKPGVWVDVYVVMDVRGGQGRGRSKTIAERILPHIQVAAIGRSTNGAPATGGSKTRPAKSVTLLVREKDVPKLHLAQTRGKLTLAMRGENEEDGDDDYRASGYPWDGSHQDDSADEPEPTTRVARVREKPHGVTIYRGGKKQTSIERITFKNAHSRMILDHSKGATTRATAMMRSNGYESPWGDDEYEAAPSAGEPQESTDTSDVAGESESTQE